MKRPFDGNGGKRELCQRGASEINGPVRYADREGSAGAIRSSLAVIFLGVFGRLSLSSKTGNDNVKNKGVVLKGRF